MKEKNSMLKWLKNKGFKYSLVLIIILSVISLAAVFSWFRRNLLESILATNYSFLEEATNQQVITIQTKLSGQWEQLTLYARIFENIEMTDYAAVKEALNVTNGFGEFKRISVANDMGYVINNDNTASGNILKQDYFIQAMEGNFSISASPDVDADGEEIFVLSIPVYQKGETAGALLGTFNRTSLQTLISEEVFGGNGTFYVIDKNGSIIMNGKHARIPESIDNYFEYMERAALKNKTLDEVKEEIHHNVGGNLEYTIGNLEQVAYYQSIPINNWVLVSIVNKNFILQQSQEISYLVVVLILAIILIMAVIMAYTFVVMRQRTKEMLNNESLKVKAERDSLTGLYNKIALEEYATRKIQEPADSSECAFALYILDLDNFKGVNDTLGHAFGDKVLCDVADCMNRIFSIQDVLGRIGGDEFIALKDMRNVPPKEREAIIKKKAMLVCEDFSRTYTSHNSNYKVSVSVGVALFGLHGMTFGELYRNADKALYEAKNNGKNNYVIFGMNREGGRSL